MSCTEVTEGAFDYGLVDEIVDRTVERLSTRSVYVFGSVTDGIPHWDSNVDVLVIEEGDPREATARIDTGYVVSRYPGDDGLVARIGPEEAEEACESALLIVGWLDIFRPRAGRWQTSSGYGVTSSHGARGTPRSATT